MAGPLRGHLADPRGRELVVARAVAEEVAQRPLGPREQAIADRPVRRQPRPVARAAERAGHRRDDADFPAAVGGARSLSDARRHIPQRRRSIAAGLGRRGQVELLAEVREDPIGGDHRIAQPLALGAQGHFLDEPQLVAALQAEVQQFHGLVVVVAGHEHRVDLDRRETRGVGGVEAAQHVVETIPAGQQAVGGRANGIEGDVDAVEAGVGEPGGLGTEKDAVGGQRRVGDAALVGAQGLRGGDDVGQPGAQERLAAGEADLADAQAFDAQGDQADDFVVGEQITAGNPVHALGRHAIRAAQIAAVGDADPQVAGDAAVGVGEPGQRGRGGANPRNGASGHMRAHVSDRTDGHRFGQLRVVDSHLNGRPAPRPG